MAFRSALASLIVASAFVACSAAQAAELGATCEQFGETPAIQQSVAVAAGTDVAIVLCSNPSTGFAWEEPRVGDATVLELVGRAYHAPDGASLPIVGAAGGEVVTIRGLAAGKTTLSVRYSQPWEGGTKGEWTYDLSLTVR